MSPMMPEFALSTGGTRIRITLIFFSQDLFKLRQDFIDIWPLKLPLIMKDRAVKHTEIWRS